VDDVCVFTLQSYANQPMSHQRQPQAGVQPQYTAHQGPAQATGPAPSANPYSRGSAYSAHYPRPHGQFPPNQ